MRYAILIAGIGAFALHASAAPAAELPTYEVKGIPISPHQVAVVGAANVRERAAESTLTSGGMPASPHQIAVLTPRSKMNEVVATKPIPNTVGASLR